MWGVCHSLREGYAFVHVVEMKCPLVLPADEGNSWTKKKASTARGPRRKAAEREKGGQITEPFLGCQSDTFIMCVAPLYTWYN